MTDPLVTQAMTALRLRAKCRKEDSTNKIGRRLSEKLVDMTLATYEACMRATME